MKHDLVIIGAGLAGCIASRAASSRSPLVIEAGQERPALSEHSAVMRFRDPSMAMLLGTTYKKITVQKAIVTQPTSATEKFTSEPCIKANNLYSKKTTGEIGNKSIQDLGFKERYCVDASNVKPSCDVNWNRTVVNINSRKRITIRVSDKLDKKGLAPIRFSSIISTMPLPVTLKACGIEVPEGTFEYNPIHVCKIPLKIKSSVNQTIYIPENTTEIYRASLSSDYLTIESMDEFVFKELIDTIDYFGLHLDDLDMEDASRSVQRFGKIKRCDEKLRKSLIMRLTDEFDIYSFGRFALWKPLRVDELNRDIKAILSMIDSKYEINRRRAGLES